MRWHRRAQVAPDQYELMGDEFLKSMNSMRLVENKIQEDESDFRSDDVIYVSGYQMYSGRIYMPKALMDHWGPEHDLKSSLTIDLEPNEYQDIFSGSDGGMNEVDTTYDLVKAEQDGDYWNVVVKIEVNGTLYYPGAAAEAAGDEAYERWVDNQRFD